MKAKLIMAIILACAVQQVHAEDLGDSLHQLVTDKAHEQNVPADLAHAVIAVESHYNPRAVNQGSYGIGQIRCGTARSMGFEGRCRDLLQPAVNLTYSLAYLRAALDRVNDNYCLAATLYNQGLMARPRKSAYCSRVLAHISN